MAILDCSLEILICSLAILDCSLEILICSLAILDCSLESLVCSLEILVCSLEILVCSLAMMVIIFINIANCPAIDSCSDILNLCNNRYCSSDNSKSGFCFNYLKSKNTYHKIQSIQ